MFTSNRGLELIKKCEGFSDSPYVCVGGKSTIGYGHVILSCEAYHNISHDVAEMLLKNDIIFSESIVQRNIESHISQLQFDALVSLTFNIGGAAFQRSTLRQKINYGSSVEEIGREFMRWIYAGGRVVKGLIRRRALEFELYTSS